MSKCQVRGCAGATVAVWDVGEGPELRWAVCRPHIRKLEDGDGWDYDGNELLMGDDAPADL